MEEIMSITRRELMLSTLAVGAMQAFPQLSEAQARRFVANCLTGSWEVAFRDNVVPVFRRDNNNADVALEPMIGVEQLAKISASKANPPLDVAILDSGPSLVAIAQDLVAPYPVERSKHYANIVPEAKSPMGIAPFFQIIGIAYNTDRITKPPTSWDDLWKPEYKGRVGITNLNSSLGLGFMVDVARKHGGSDSNIEEAFKRLDELKPNIGAVATNPSQAAALFQQGQIDIAPAIFNEIMLLKGHDVPVDFVLPKDRGVGYTSTMHIVKNSPYAELAFQYIETSLSPEVQTKMMQNPYLVVPTNSNVTLTGEIAKLFGSTEQLKEKLTFLDWNAINPKRGDWADRFNREVKI
jgi:putative spermidine/putrescine transport system substrate-binding protein